MSKTHNLLLSVSNFTGLQSQSNSACRIIKRSKLQNFLHKLSEYQRSEVRQRTVLNNWRNKEQSIHNEQKFAELYYTVPRFSISLIQISTTAGISVFWALTRVVRSMPNILLMYFMSGRQSLGTFSEHFLCAFRPQSKTPTATFAFYRQQLYV